MKTVFYVDGFNLFYGCLKNTDDKWLDLKKLLVDYILHEQDPKSQFSHIKYFTAPIMSKVATRGQQASQAQQTYLRALQFHLKDQIQIIQGYYTLEKGNLPEYQSPLNKRKTIEVWRLEEKQTDVNIALAAYRDASLGRAEQLVFVTNDSDIAPAIKAIREDMGASVKIGVILPIRGTSERPDNKQLSEYSDWTRRYIRESELSDSHLPEQVPTRKKPARKPDYW